MKPRTLRRSHSGRRPVEEPGADHSLLPVSHAAIEEWSQTLERWTATRANALWRAHSDAVNMALIGRWVPEKGIGRVLKTDLFDEAVGEGLVGELMARAEEVVGVDLAPPVVDAATTRQPGLKGTVADIRRLPFEAASFDLVVSNSTLDHFDALNAVSDALSEIARVVRPDGGLLITLDNRQNPVVALRTSRAFAGLFRRLGLVPYELGVTCGRRRLSGLLDRAGFEVQATEAIMHCPPQVAGKLADRLLGGGSAATHQDDHLRRVLRFEALGRWPTRYLTAHFVAAWAIRRSPRPLSAR
jgi:SAM-dependent methyltransferase